MIKVELFYNVNILGTEKMMTAEEYEEFREQALNIPLAVMYPRVEPIKPIDYIATVESTEEDQADQCPDYIEPPVVSKSMGAGLEPEIICENGACTLVLPEEEEVTESPPKVTKSSEILTETEEKEQEKPKKEQKQKPQLDRDYTPYITMLVNGEKPAIIRKKMMKDFGITEGTANTYYYAKVRPEAEIIKAENEEKAKVETVEEKKPAPGKFFTDEERLRIQKKLGLK